MLTIKSARFERDTRAMLLRMSNETVVRVPLDSFAELRDCDSAALSDWRLIADGEGGIEWPALNVDLALFDLLNEADLSPDLPRTSPEDQAFLRQIELQGHAARDQLNLAIAVNAAVNGRVFCLGLFLLAALSWAITRDSSWGAFALAALMPIGCAAILDRLPASRLKTVSTWAVYGLAIAVWVLSFIKLATIG